jgi:hypothetical protein
VSLASNLVCSYVDDRPFSQLGTLWTFVKANAIVSELQWRFAGNHATEAQMREKALLATSARAECS